MVRSGAGSTRAAAAGRRSDGGATTLARSRTTISPTKTGGYQRGSGPVLTVAHNIQPVRQVLIGIDVGLSSLKVAAFDREGRLVGQGQTGYQTERPAPDRV